MHFSPAERKLKNAAARTSFLEVTFLVFSAVSEEIEMSLKITLLIFNCYCNLLPVGIDS